MREKVSDYWSDRKLLVFVVLVLGFTILGPFGTYSLFDIWSRLVFWAICIAVIGALMHIIIVLAIISPNMAVLPRPVRIAVGSMIAALPGTAVIIFFTGYMFPIGIGPSSFPFIWFQIASVGFVAGLFEYRPPKTESEENEQAAPQTRFHARLPKGALHDIVSLTMHDHYVEVTTTTGRHMVLARLSDAIAELEGLEGVQLHRSHWAAARHLAGLTRQNRKTLAILSDGRTLPVGKQGAERAEALIGGRRATDSQ